LPDFISGEPANRIADRAGDEELWQFGDWNDADWAVGARRLRSPAQIDEPQLVSSLQRS